MTIKPILFSAPMVLALLGGRKTQTRRVMKGVERDNRMHLKGSLVRTHVIDAPMHGLTQFAVGDLLWVRETWARIDEVECGCSEAPCQCPQLGEIRYRATVGDDDGRKWKPSIFMPRKYSRLTLEVTDVRAELLRDISEEDAKAEGVPEWLEGNDGEEIYCHTCDGNGVRGALSGGLGLPEIACPECDTSVKKFRNLWDTLNKKRGFGWDTNPWVSVTTFKVHQCNVADFKQREAA
ncbi:hypothetical protein [Polycladidibacter hongkongensis]|uniref:hypothetical protein n=1 Tax=Polycladidibacter hongkongensis TaxID=1647556 RepID=UPI00082F07C3|nr:hypothetical protein [Pseudovibrio hongkongensis]